MEFSETTKKCQEFHLLEVLVRGILVNVVESNQHLFYKLVFHVTVSCKCFPMSVNNLKYTETLSMVK